MSRVDDALAHFKCGYSCSQAIAVAFGPDCGLDQDTAAKVAGGFGGGMRMGSVCGAVTGAYMILGMRYFPANRDSRSAGYEKIQEFTRRFQERNGTVICKELLSGDATSSQPGQQPGRKKSCTQIVQDAAEILEEMLQGTAAQATLVDDRV